LEVIMPQSSHPLLAARRDQMFPTLAQAEIDRLRRFGEPKSYRAGERIVTAGKVSPGLIIVLSGKVEVTQGSELDRREIIVTHGPGQF
jgi:thioredoxin reductase (NADPH)